MIVFVIIYSIIGVDVQMQSGEVVHYVLSPFDAIVAGFKYIGMVAVAILGLFNPATAADTVANSTSIVGIAVLSKTASKRDHQLALFFGGYLGLARSCESAAHPTARWWTLRDRGLPEDQAQEHLHPRTELPEHRWNVPVHGFLRVHAQPGCAALHLRELELGVCRAA